MQQYLDLVKQVLFNGVDSPDRTGTGVRSIFGYQMRFPLEEKFPLLTTKRVYWKGVVYELLWFLRGDTNVKFLHENNVHIWDEWADKDGNLGKIYGKQWRSWETHNGYFYDQIGNVIHNIKHHPTSRRLVVSAWNPGELEEMALPPCHCLFQFYVAEGKLSCQLYQRSCDVFLGLPFNIASYALLTHMIASVCDLEVGEFVWTGGHVHLYHNHFPQAYEQITREPRELPILKVAKKENINNFGFDDFELIGYNPMPAIKAPIAV